MTNSDLMIKQETIDYLQKIEALSDCISTLDNHAVHFRFPSNDIISIKTDSLLNTYDLYCNSDAFLTFGTNVAQFTFSVDAPCIGLSEYLVQTIHEERNV